jgi:tripartite-type tricarboxylate transporter receptor subunit TctC
MIERCTQRIVGLGLIGLVLFAAVGCGPEGPYPQRTIQIVVPWAAGGGTDRLARFWAEALQKELGQRCVVVNRTGGSGAVGHTAGAQAKPDGYTLTAITFELSTMHWMDISPLTYEDFDCLLQTNADPAALIVRADSDWKTLDDLLKTIRERPGELKMSGTATGGAWDLARAGLLQAAGLPAKAVIWKPTQGSAPSLHELLGGHLDVVCCSLPEAMAQLSSGELRALVVMTEQRLAEFPDIPTTHESGVAWTAVGWRGLALPKGTPAEIANQLEQACLKIGASDAYREFMAKQGFGITLRGRDDFRTFLAEQDQQWKAVVEAAGYAR